MIDINWFGGIINFTIPTYVIIGVILIILGILIAAFMPIVGKKFGLITFIVGLTMAAGFPLIADWWKNDVFKIVVSIVGVLILALIVLFAGVPTPKGGKK